MTDGEKSLRSMYGRNLPWLVVLTFALALAFGCLIRFARGGSEGLFESPWNLIALATGTAVGQLIAAIVVRRHLRP